MGEHRTNKRASPLLTSVAPIGECWLLWAGHGHCPCGLATGKHCPLRAGRGRARPLVGGLGHVRPPMQRPWSWLAVPVGGLAVASHPYKWPGNEERGSHLRAGRLQERLLSARPTARAADHGQGPCRGSHTQLGYKGQPPAAKLQAAAAYGYDYRLHERPLIGTTASRGSAHEGGAYEQRHCLLGRPLEDNSAHQRVETTGDDMKCCRLHKSDDDRHWKGKGLGFSFM
ncbi:hypothetical protein GW17_00034000 [Ensete ventricosum]|nr:hypothetical protein GW17_00034000 [Ensete ventricosum]